MLDELADFVAGDHRFELGAGRIDRVIGRRDDEIDAFHHGGEGTGELQPQSVGGDVLHGRGSPTCVEEIREHRPVDVALFGKDPVVCHGGLDGTEDSPRSGGFAAVGYGDRHDLRPVVP